MQQFFELVNSVLQQNPDTQKRKLRIATYKVTSTPFQLGWTSDANILLVMHDVPNVWGALMLG